MLPLQNLYQLPVKVFWKVKEKLETHFVITQIQHIRRPVISWAIQLWWWWYRLKDIRRPVRLGLDIISTQSRWLSSFSGPRTHLLYTIPLSHNHTTKLSLLWTQTLQSLPWGRWMKAMKLSYIQTLIDLPRLDSSQRKSMHACITEAKNATVLIPYTLIHIHIHGIMEAKIFRVICSIVGWWKW